MSFWKLAAGPLAGGSVGECPPVQTNPDSPWRVIRTGLLARATGTTFN